MIHQQTPVCVWIREAYVSHTQKKIGLMTFCIMNPSATGDWKGVFLFPKKKPLLMLHWWQSSRNGIRPFDFHWASDYNINSWFVTHLAIGQFKSCRLASFVSDDKVRQLSSSLQLDTEGLSLWAAFYKLLLMMPTAILSGGSILWSFWWADYLVPDFTARKEKGSNKPVAYWNFLEQNL